MAETVIAAIEVGIQLYSIAQQLPQDVATWKLNNRLLPEKLQSFRKTLELVADRLENFRESLEKTNGVPNNQFQRHNTVLKVQQCIGELSTIAKIVVDLEERAKSSKILQPIVTELEKVTPKYEQLLAKIDELSKDVESISTIHEDTTVWAPAVSPDYYFDLDSSTRDNPVSKVLGNILSAENHPVGAVLVGSGGMGKTTAACHVAWDVKTKMQFKDGILFTELGYESSEKDVIAKVAGLVQRFDHQDLVEEIKKAASVDEAVTRGSSAFKEKKCMIVFDDVWAERIKSVDIVVALSKLVTCDGTKVVFTTRDTKYLAHPLTSKVAVFLNKRGRDESERMLVKSAGLEKPEFEEGLNVFNSILDDADGMPLALSLAGNAIKQISLDRDDNYKHYAWSDYGRDNTEASGQLKANNDILQQMQERIMKSISYIQRQTGNSKYIEYFRALSVFQKAERMPYSVLCRAFGESNRAAIEILETLKKYGIVSVKRGEDATSNRYVTIHDLVLDCARSLVDNSEEMKTLIMNWLSSFQNRGRDVVSTMEASCAADSFKKWWPETEDDEDNYLYRNVIRILERACMFEEMVWLVNEPWWISKQLKSNGLQQIQRDLEMSLQCVRNIAVMEQDEHEIMEKWIRLLSATILTSYEYISGCDWDGMLHTQLYGRLQYYAEAAIVVETFLEKVKESAPGPFFLPRLGSFPTVSPQLLKKIQFEGYVLSCKQINDCICTAYIFAEELSQQSTYTTDERSEEKHMYILMLQTNDLSNGSVSREEIMRTNYKLSGRGALSDSGHIICVGTTEGDIILLEKQFELAENTGGEGLSQDDTNEDAVTPNQSSKRQIVKGFIKKHARRMLFGRGFESKKNPMPASRDTSNMVRISSEVNWRSTVLCGHNSMVVLLAVSSNDTRIVSYSYDTLHVWEVENNEWKYSVLRGLESIVDTVAISANGTRIVSCSSHDTGRIWQVENDEWKSALFVRYDDNVGSVALSADGTRIVFGTRNGMVQVGQLEKADWEFIALHGNKGNVESVAISADGSRILSGSDENIVCVWEVENEDWKFTALRGHEDRVTSVAMLADGKRIVSCSVDRTVRIWEMTSDEWKPAALSEPDSSTKSLAISADGTRIVSWSFDNAVRVWEVENDEWKSTVLHHDHDGQEGSVHGTMCNAVISAAGRHIVFGTNDNTVHVWELKNGEWKFTSLHGHESLVSTVAISADGSRIVSGSYDNTVRAWKVENDEWKSTVWRGHEGRVFSVAISADGTRIASGAQDNTVRVCEMENDEWKSTVREHEGWVFSVEISADGTRILSVAIDMSADGMRNKFFTSDPIEKREEKTVRVWEKENNEWKLSKTISFVYCGGIDESENALMDSEAGSPRALTVAYAAAPWAQGASGGIPRGGLPLPLCNRGED